MAEKEHDISMEEKFLKQVDEIQSIVQALNSKDETVSQAAMQKAGEMLQKIDLDDQKKKKKKHQAPDRTGVNRTLINQAAFKDGPVPSAPAGTEDVSQQAFMAALEKDAEERYQRKKKAEKKAIELKDQGNIEFKAGNYKKAVEFYTEALSNFKDMTALWTNRAQAYIKLEMYQEALEDCEWAMRVFENCLKAYIHQGRAHLGLRQYDKAIESFSKAMKIEPSKQSAIQGYIAEVELARQTAEQEKSAKELFGTSDEARGLVGLIEQINKPDQLPMYYSGGLRIIMQVLQNTTERTLFRTSGGLHLTRDHPVISKCFAASPRSLSREEIDMCAAYLDCLMEACTDNEENQKQIIEQACFPEQLQRFLETKVKGCKFLQESCINLLHQLSQTDIGRSRLVAKFDLSRLLSSLFHLLQQKSAMAVRAVSFLNNLALDKKFKSQMRGNLEESVLPAFENLLTEGAKNPSVLPCCISTMTNLSADVHMRRKMVSRTQTWNACCTILESHTARYSEALSLDILYATLGLLMNLTYELSDNMKGFSTTLCRHCCVMMDCGEPTLEERSLGLMSHLLPHSDESVDFVCEQGIPRGLLAILQKSSNELTKPALKSLAACTQRKAAARQMVAECEKGPQMLVGLLKHKDETVVGNAALILSHCAQIPGICEQLADSDVMKQLLVLARDGRKPALQQNCAILIAKLTQGDSRHLEKLRELEGLGILHDVMKYIK